MFIKSINIENFRNYDNQKLELSPNINILYGFNAQGKTNLLEAIYFCAFGKSFRTSKEKEVIKKNEKFSNIELLYQKKDREGKINISLSDKKIISVNDIKIKKLSELLGNLNIVIFTPDDINILKNGPEERRRFLNVMISQLRSGYVYHLNNYMKTLEQRNNYLKSSNSINEEMLEIWDEKLAEHGEKIYSYRKEFIEKIKEKVKDIHSKVTSEEIKLHYISDCEDKNKFLEKLKQTRNIDREKGYTTKGIHRDDFKVFINGEEVKIYGSQGQNRTAILSLKLAELQVIYEDVGEYPILLLDDFMSELDEKRITKFLESIENIQVIITCTKDIKIENSKSYKIENGKVVENIV